MKLNLNNKSVGLILFLIFQKKKITATVVLSDLDIWQ